MKIQIISLILLGCVMLAGCWPASENPLSDPNTAQYDNELIGLWGIWPPDSNGSDSKRSEPTGWIHFIEGQEKKTVVVYVIEKDKEEDEGGALIYEMYPTEIGPHRYMNLTIPESLKEAYKDATGYFFERYEVSESGKLQIWLLKSNAIEEAIRQNKLKGTISKDLWTSNVKITDTSENIVTFLKENANNKDLFELVLVGYRPKIIWPEEALKKENAGTD